MGLIGDAFSNWISNISKTVAKATNPTVNQKQAEISKIGTGKVIPDSVYTLYKAGTLNKYLPKGEPRASDTKNDILNAYNSYLRCQPSPMPVSKYESKTEEDQAIALWDALFGFDSTSKEPVKDNIIEIVNTPLAYETAVAAGVLPSIEDMLPYMITIDQNSGTQDYKRLKDMGVQGVCIDIGSYYSIIRTINPTFRQPKLESQIKAAQDAKMPFGLYTTVRARSIAEANNELAEIRNVVRSFAPQVGFWLKLNLGTSVTTNNAILAHYYTELYRLGLNDQIGIYATRDQLKQISWSKFFDQFYLWLDEHVNSVEDIPHPVTPEFFKCRDVS